MGKNKRFLKDLKAGVFADMVKEAVKDQKLNNSLELFNIVKPIFAQENDVEKMFILFMDSKNAIISIECLATGSISACNIYPRELIKRTLKLKASAIVMAHNHPSGDARPSREDVLITTQILYALNSIGVTLHEHIIIGRNYFSMADQGIISHIKMKFEQTLQNISSDSYNYGQRNKEASTNES